ncbi:MAG TPA: hypothetical protein VFB95_11805 [Candidatus Cryosericum sp.]|nr:hypothetical protein [Candidatus Cryosericum sp.]
MSQCDSCGAPLAEDETTCRACGRQLAGMSQVAEVPLEEEAVLIHQLLESAGFHPMLAWLDDRGRPRPIKPGTMVSPAIGLLPPVTTPFAVFVPEEEADEARLVLQDAGRQSLSGETSAF